MPTQVEIAEHLGLSQPTVHKHMAQLGIDWTTASMDEIRLAYLEHLRGLAAGHRTHDGMDLTRERAMTEKVDRELKELALAEKRGQLVNVAQLEPELTRMVVAFRTELLASDDKLKAEIDAFYGIDLDLAFLNEHTRNSLRQLARYDPEHQGDAASSGEAGGAAGDHDDDGMGASASPALG